MNTVEPLYKDGGLSKEVASHEGKINIDFEGILPKGPYLPCVSMAGRDLLAGYPRFVKNGTWMEIDHILQI